MTPRLVLQIRHPFLVQLLTKKNPLGTLIHRPVVSAIPISSPLDREKDTCCYVETDNFGNVDKKCFNRVHLGRSGFLCKMHHDLDVRMKPQHRTIYNDNSDPEEVKLRTKMQKEMEVGSPVGLDYKTYVQWGWTRQPLLFVEDKFGQMAQAFSDPELWEED